MQLRATRLTAIASAVRRFFSPSSLFAAGEQGAWYDPSDWSTLYQDSAGTTPVTAVEQPVGLMLDKSKGLVLGPELVTNGDFSSGLTGWGSGTGNSTLSLVDGEAKSTRIAVPTADARFFAYSLSVVGGRRYRVEFDVYSANYAGPIRVGISALGPTPGALSASVSISTAKTRRVCIVEATAAAIGLEFAGGSGVIVQVGNELVIDNISVRELPGNHAYQTTSTSRPVLSARYNLLTKTEQFDDAVWTKTRATVTQNDTIAPDGTLTADKLVEDTTSGRHTARQTISKTAAAESYTVTWFLKAAGRQFVRVELANSTESASANVFFDIVSGTVITAPFAGGGFAAVGASIESVGNGWWRVTLTATTDASSAISSWLNMAAAGTTGSEFYTGDGTSGIYIWGASLVPANQASIPYQRVNTATDYDADPAKFKPYLKFDGVDDFLVTNSIDFTSTDKMTVFAGVRKLSDAAAGVLAELSATAALNNGAFYLINGNTGGTPGYTGYGFSSRGSINGNVSSPSGFVAPLTNVLAGLGNISGDSAILRVNGVQAGQSATDQGTGPYGNYPLYIGRRGGTTLPFNGQLYSLIVRGAATSDTQVSQTETWVNQRTGAY